MDDGSRSLGVTQETPDVSINHAGAGKAFGELIQIDGSDHRWFEDRGAPCMLLVFIDDATLTQLLFVASESVFGYLEALERYLTTHGRPLTFTPTSRACSASRSGTPRAVMA